MKKTLFAVAALALCGTAFADTYRTSTINVPYFSAGGRDVIFIVDQSVNLNMIELYYDSVTLNFVGNASVSVNMYYGPSDTSLSVTGDPMAQSYWESALITTENYKTITLISCAEEAGFPRPPYVASFIGKTANEPLTLGNTEVTYVGCYNNIDDAIANISDNTVALVVGARAEPGSLSIVGKISPVPEPATATLSLLALAGLATRRRRK